MKTKVMKTNLKINPMKTPITGVRPFRPALSVLTGVCALTFPTPHEASAAVMSWGGVDYVLGTHVEMEGNTGVGLSGSDKYGEPDGYPLPTALVGRAFSSTTALSPPSGYFGPTFYGGGSVTSTNPDVNEGYHEFGVRNGGFGDSINWRVDSNSGDTHSTHAFVYFKKEEFESPWSIWTVDSGDLASTAFQIHTGQISQAGPQDLSLYWVVQDGSQFYVAQTPISIAQNSSYSTPFNSISGWAPYDPTGGLAALDFNELSTFSAHTFTDVQGVGFYAEHEDGASQSHVDINGFALVPEPSTSLLLFGALGGLLGIRRRNH